MGKVKDAATRDRRFDYVRDDARQRIVVTAHKALRAADLIAIIDRQVAEGAWSFAILYDLSGVRGVTPHADSLIVADRVQKYVTTYGGRGPVALVTRDPEMVGVGQSYAYGLTASGVPIQVFWDRSEAEEWLARDREAR